MESIIIEDVQLLCHAGDSEESVLQAVQNGTLTPLGKVSVGGQTVPAGTVAAPLPVIEHEAYATRTNALILHCLQRLKHLSNVSPERLGVVMGSSNAGIEEFHNALQNNTVTAQDWQRLEPGTVSDFVAAYTGAKGPAFTLSTACSSSAKALAAAARLLEAGICDAVIAGGGDALCRFALEGFHALQLISKERSEPFKMNGGGINHGEGAALFLLTKRAPKSGDILLSGYGETADAHHTTTPEPEGKQAARAMRQALAMARLEPRDIDYINMHGTGTDANDLMEMNALAEVFGTACPPCSSTKPYTGHTLGAAGAVEAGICVALLRANTGHLPRSTTQTPPPGYPHINLSATATRPVKHCISNSFAFGGNNCALILSRHD